MRKVKPAMNALFLIGTIYSIFGGIFVIMGAVFWIMGGDSELQMVGAGLAGGGSIFLLLGVVFLWICLNRRKRERKLVEAGRYIWGEIVECEPNYQIRINNRHPYIAVVRYQDSHGTVHIFRSGNLSMYPAPSILNRKVKVYISDDTFRHYYVDILDVLPHTIEH